MALHIDYWYGNGNQEKKKIAYVTCQFYDLDCEYRGNIYDADKKPIGDFWSKDSVAIEKRFPGIFN